MLELWLQNFPSFNFIILGIGYTISTIWIYGPYKITLGKYVNFGVVLMICIDNGFLEYALCMFTHVFKV